MTAPKVPKAMEIPRPISQRRCSASTARVAWEGSVFVSFIAGNTQGAGSVLWHSSRCQRLECAKRAAEMIRGRLLLLARVGGLLGLVCALVRLCGAVFSLVGGLLGAIGVVFGRVLRLF